MNTSTEAQHERMLVIPESQHERASNLVWLGALFLAVSVFANVALLLTLAAMDSRCGCRQQATTIEQQTAPVGRRGDS